MTSDRKLMEKHHHASDCPACAALGHTCPSCAQASAEKTAGMEKGPHGETQSTQKMSADCPDCAALGHPCPACAAGMKDGSRNASFASSPSSPKPSEGMMHV